MKLIRILIERLQNPPVFVLPEQPKTVLSPARYAHKTAFHIDPLLAASVVIEQPVNPRGRAERYGTDLWKQRSRDDHGRPVWKPMLVVMLLIGAVAVRSSEQTFAAPARAPVDVGKSDNRVPDTLRALEKLHKIGYVWTTATGADRAIRHWQKVNGLVVDGVVGQATLRSLNLDTVVVSVVATRPAVRVVPPSPTLAPARGVAGWHDLAIAVGWTETQWSTLSCIIQRESGGNANAKNKNSSATGLLQILARFYPGVNLYDAETNLRVGLDLFNLRGWQPWTLPGNQCY